MENTDPSLYRDTAGDIDWETTLRENDLFDKVSCKGNSLHVAYLNSNLRYDDPKRININCCIFTIHPNEIIVKYKEDDNFNARFSNTPETIATLKKVNYPNEND